jgi:hypothetical protein
MLLIEKFMKIFYAVFVLNLSLRENKSSVVKISNRLMAVVATSLMRKIKKLPKDSHSKNNIYP